MAGHAERPSTARIATETADYLLRELRQPGGGFSSSQDADSEGVEGRFFVWSWDELVEAGSEAVATAFGATPVGNWEGTNVLWRPMPLEAVAQELELDATELAGDVDAARGELFRRREQRVRPATDDKVLAAWNGLAIAALAEAGRAFEEPRYVDAAVTAGSFVLSNLRDAEGRLLRSWRDGRAGRPGFADDHALMADACLALYETTFELRWFEHARALGDELLAPVPRRGARRVLPDGVRRRGARAASEGAVRQRRPERQLGRRRGPPTARRSSRERPSTWTPASRRSA